MTILLYKKGNLHHLTRHRPIALANTIYKLFTSTLTSIFSTYGKKYQILHDIQEGFRAERCTAKQLQTLITTLEGARLTIKISISYTLTSKMPSALWSCQTPCHYKRHWLSTRCRSPSRQYLLTIHYHIYWRTFWQNTTNTYTKRNYTRRHIKPIYLYHLSWTAPQMATKRKQWLFL